MCTKFFQITILPLLWIAGDKKLTCDHWKEILIKFFLCNIESCWKLEHVYKKFNWLKQKNEDATGNENNPQHFPEAIQFYE